MSYTLTGSFIEACDCFIVCPCWVDEDADDAVSYTHLTLPTILRV